MTIDESVDGGITVLRLGGELDLRSAPVLKARLDGRAASNRPLTVLNLEQLTYVDSAGLGVLIGAVKAHTGQAGRLVLAAPRPDVRHILEITRVTHYLPIHANEAEAVAALTRTA